MVELKDIQELADRIAREFNPERIILFGSYARGNPTPDSDVDLLVLIDHRGKDWEFAARIRNRVGPVFPLDLVVRTPAQLRTRVAWGDPFLRDIVNQGKVLL